MKWEQVCFAVLSDIHYAQPCCSHCVQTALRVSSATFGCLLAGRIHYSHPLCHGYSGRDVMCECCPGIGVLERIIVCLGSVSFAAGSAWPRRAGRGSVWAMVRAGRGHAMSLLLRVDKRPWPTWGLSFNINTWNID